MPRYDFKCRVCGKIREESFPTFKAADAANLYCSDDGSRLMRMISRTEFVIKGYSAKNGYAKKE